LTFSLQKDKIVAREVERMDYNYLLKKMIEENNGYIRLIDAQNNGISKYQVMEFVRQNKMEKVASGVYIAVDAWEDRLYELQLRNRKIIFSHETALYIHNLSDREPFAPVISVMRGYNASHLKQTGVIVHTVKPELFELGLIDAETFAGNIIRVYDKERCICDVIKRKRRMDIQIFQTALTSYFADKEKDINKLMDYAKKMKIEDWVRQYTEVLL